MKISFLSFCFLRSFCKGELRSQSGFQQVRGKQAIVFRFCDRISENSKNLERSRVLLLAESEQLRFNFAIVFLKTQKFGTKNKRTERERISTRWRKTPCPDFIPTCWILRKSGWNFIPNFGIHPDMNPEITNTSTVGSTRITPLLFARYLVKSTPSFTWCLASFQACKQFTAHDL